MPVPNQPTTGVNPAGIPNADIASALSNPNAANLASPQITPVITPVTPTATRNPGESITDFTTRLDTKPANTDYGFTSEADFYAKTGLKDMSSVQVLKPGATPTSDLYKYDNSPQVYQKAKAPDTSGAGTPPVGTSDAERAKAKADEIAKIKAELGAGTQAPTPYKSADEYQKLRTEQGVVKDEEELSSIRNEAALAKEELNKFKQTSSAGMPEGGYLGGISEAERNLNLRLESLSLRESAVVDRLNNKNSYISTMVNLGQQDYATANAAYTAEYNKNVKAIEMYNTEIDNQQKDALTGFTTITNLLKDQGVGTLTPEISQQLDSLALKAGLPSGLFQTVIKSLGNEKILAPVTVDNASGGKDVYFYTQGADGVPHLKAVQNLNGGGTGDAQQQKLEQQYRSLLSKELSNRSGGLGMQDAKVNQAIHLKALLDQYKDANGNYNVPASQYAELAMGLAALVSGTNAVSDSARDAITQRTLAGDFKGAITYITGTPIAGTTQDVIKNLADSIDRQGNVAEDLRDQYVKLIQGQAPTDLEKSRIDALNSATLPSYRNYGKNTSTSGGGTIIYQGKTYQVDADGNFDLNKPIDSTDGKTPVDINKAMESGGLSFDQAGKPQASNIPVNAKLASALVSKNPAPYGIINGYDITNYATDPGHEKKVYVQYQTLQREGVTANNPASIDKFIQSRASGSPIRGADVVKAAKEFNVDPLLMVALMQIDSSFGTAGKAVKTKNPGNVGNTDSGGTQGFSSWYAGIRAVAQNISKRRYTKTA